MVAQNFQVWFFRCSFKFSFLSIVTPRYLNCPKSAALSSAVSASQDLPPEQEDNVFSIRLRVITRFFATADEPVEHQAPY